MTCRNTREHLIDYLDGNVAPAIREAIEVELRTCPECRSTVRQARELRKELAALPRHDAPPAVRRAVLEAVRRSASLPRKQNVTRWLPSRPLLAAAALLLVGTVGAFVVGSSWFPGRDGGRLLEVVILDVERDLDTEQRSRLLEADPFRDVTPEALGLATIPGRATDGGSEAGR